jgi:hypothetical protein
LQGIEASSTRLSGKRHAIGVVPGFQKILGRFTLSAYEDAPAKLQGVRHRSKSAFAGS